MDVISDHSQGSGQPPAGPRFDRRIRWGNVALALAALVAIVAAVGLPRGNPAGAAQQLAVPATEPVTAISLTAPTATFDKPPRHRGRKAHSARKQRKRKRAKTRVVKRPIPAAPVPTPQPAPAPPAPDQTPAAEREFGL